MVLFSVWAGVLYLCSCVYPNASRDAYHCRSTRTANYHRQLREAGAAMTTHSRLDATTRPWKRRDTPRLFKITYNHNKVKPYRSGRYQIEVDANRRQSFTRDGVVWVHGTVSLDNGDTYKSLSDMQEQLSVLGECEEPQFLDEQERAE